MRRASTARCGARFAKGSRPHRGPRPPRASSAATPRATTRMRACREARLSPRIPGEDGRHRGVDSFFRLGATQAVETLLDGGMPQRLVALRVIQVHRDDALVVHVRFPTPGVRIPPPPAPTRTLAPTS